MSYILSNTTISDIMCPYCDMGVDICTASCSSMEIDNRMRMKYCANENYDDCPIFLVKNMISRR
jgi:hypothetical protein